jgi:transcriptional regulator with XRE-family HTH domain
MNFTQMQIQLRRLVADRLKNGPLTLSELARQTGLARSHLSNFLREKRLLSQRTADCILRALKIQAEDLLPRARGLAEDALDTPPSAVPIVSHATALREPIVHPSSVLEVLPPAALRSLRPHSAARRQVWQRFVAVRIQPPDTLPMEPLILPDAVVVIDRHYNTHLAYTAARHTLYAIRHGAHLKIRYLGLSKDMLILRPLSLAEPVELVEIEPGASPTDLIVGRVVLVLNKT